MFFFFFFPSHTLRNACIVQFGSYLSKKEKKEKQHSEALPTSIKERKTPRAEALCPTHQLKNEGQEGA